MRLDHTASKAPLQQVRTKRRALLLGPLVAATLTALITWMLPPKYVFTAKLLVLESGLETPSDGLPLMLGTKIPNPYDTLAGMLYSDALIQEVSRQFNITPKDFKDEVTVQKDIDSNQLHIVTKGVDPKYRIALLQSVLLKFETVSKTLNVTTAERQAALLTNAITSKRQELRKKRIALANLQRTMTAPVDPTNATSLTEPYARVRKLEFELGTVKQAIDSMLSQATKARELAASVPTIVTDKSPWRAKLRELEYELERESRISGPEAPSIRRLQDAIDVTRREAEREYTAQLSSLQQGLEPESAKLFAQREVLGWQLQEAKRIAASAPQEATELAELLADIGTQTAVLTNLESEYERARVKAEVDRIRWVVLDPPTQSYEAINKRYVFFSGTAAMAVLLLLLLYFQTLTTKHRPSSDSSTTL
ncbi:MAG: hypothetical protein AMXMBFR81_15070 [Chthonomonas sp.]